LLERAIAGDEQALTCLLEEAGPRLHAELERRIADRHRAVVDADDLFQVTCMEAFLRIRAFQPSGPASFGAWLRRIAQNNLLDAVKELERDRRPPPGRRVEFAGGDESYVTLVERLAGSATTPSQRCASRELREGVDAALHQLPPDYEQVLRLYELEGLSGAEAAEILGRSHGAVRMMLARARERLTEILTAMPQFVSRA